MTEQLPPGGGNHLLSNTFYNSTKDYGYRVVPRLHTLSHTNVPHGSSLTLSSAEHICPSSTEHMCFACLTQLDYSSQGAHWSASSPNVGRLAYFLFARMELEVEAEAEAKAMVEE